MENELLKDQNLECEMMRYRSNGLSYKLGFGGIACSILAAFICLNSFNPNSFLVIVKILMNIAILLFGFLSIEKAKAYSKQGSIILIVIGGINLARIFWVPFLLILNYNLWASAGEADKRKYEQFIGKTITSDNRYLISYLPQDGNFRGWFAIILLILSAVFFISAGVIGLKKSVKLSNYMESLKENK